MLSACFAIPSISRMTASLNHHTIMAQAARALKIFLRQPFTQSSKSDVARIQSVMDAIKSSDGKPYKLDFLTAPIAESEDSFKIAFETSQRKSFTPFNFRNHRLGLLKEADAFIIIKTSLSESTAFEVAYNIFGGRNVPMLFAIHESSFPIKTTLLRELDDLASHVEYVTFKNGEELQGPVQSFLKRVDEIKKAKSSTLEKPTSSPRPTVVHV